MLRIRTRASSGGYTLIELMVVVVLIAILSMLAAPSLIRGRSDRLAFSFARTVQEQIHNSRSRAAGRGAAQLVVFSQTEFGARGAVFTFEALDGTLPAATPFPGPGPKASCRQAGQWNWVKGFTSASPSVDPAYSAMLIDGLTINSTAVGDVVITENITMNGMEPDPGGGPATAVPAFVLCVTPNGTTYYGRGGSIAAAVDAMSLSNPYTGAVEIDVARHDSANNVVGLKRRVIVAGAAAPRIKSE